MTGPHKVFDRIETIDGIEETQKMADCMRSVEKNLDILSDGLKERFRKLVISQIGSLQSKYTDPRNYTTNITMRVPSAEQTSVDNTTNAVHTQDYTLDNEKKIQIELARFFPKQSPSPVKKPKLVHTKVMKSPSTAKTHESPVTKTKNNKPRMRRIVSRQDERFDKYSLTSGRTSSPINKNMDEVLLNNLSPRKSVTLERRSLYQRHSPVSPRPRTPTRSPLNDKLESMVKDMRDFRERHSPRSPRSPVSNRLSPDSARDVTTERALDKDQSKASMSLLDIKPRQVDSPVVKERLRGYNPSDYSVRVNQRSPISRKVVTFQSQPKTRDGDGINVKSSQSPVHMFSKPNITFDSPPRRTSIGTNRSQISSNSTFTDHTRSQSERETRSGSFYPIYLDMQNRRPVVETMNKSSPVKILSPEQILRSANNTLSSNLESMIQRQRERYKTLHKRLRSNDVHVIQSPVEKDNVPSPRYSPGMPYFRPGNPSPIIISKPMSPVSPSRTYSVASSTEEKRPNVSPTILEYNDISRSVRPDASPGLFSPRRYDKGSDTTERSSTVSQQSPMMSEYSSPPPVSRQRRKYKGPPRILSYSPTESFDGTSYRDSDDRSTNIYVQRSPSRTAPQQTRHCGISKDISSIQDSGYTSNLLSGNGFKTPATQGVGSPLATSSPKVCHDCRQNSQSPITDSELQNEQGPVVSEVTRQLDNTFVSTNQYSGSCPYQGIPYRSVDVSCQTETGGKQDQLGGCTVTTTITVNGRVCAVGRQTPALSSCCIPTLDAATSPIKVSEHLSPVQTLMCSPEGTLQQDSPASTHMNEHVKPLLVNPLSTPLCTASQTLGATKQEPSDRTSECSPACSAAQSSPVPTEVSRPPSPVPTVTTPIPLDDAACLPNNGQDVGTDDSHSVSPTANLAKSTTPPCPSPAGPYTPQLAPLTEEYKDLRNVHQCTDMGKYQFTATTCMANLRSLICQIKVATRKFVVEGANNIPLWQVLYSKASMLESQVTSLLEGQRDDSQITNVIYDSRMEETLYKKLDELMVVDRRNYRLLEVIYGEVVDQIDLLKACAYDRGRHSQDAAFLSEVQASVTQLKLVTEYFLNIGSTATCTGSNWTYLYQATPFNHAADSRCREPNSPCCAHVHDVTQTPITSQMLPPLRSDDTQPCMSGTPSVAAAQTSHKSCWQRFRECNLVILAVAFLVLLGTLTLIYSASGSIRDVIISVCLFIWCNLRLIHTHGGPVV